MGARVIIIGGGISGLSTAFYLKQRGIASTIVEATARLGGLIRTDQVDGCELEAGPDSFIASKPAVAELARELDLTGELISSNDGSRRVFVVRDGQLTALPKGMVMMVPSDWSAALRSSLFSAKTKAQFVREYLFPPRQRSGDFSIREFVLDHFGEEALHYVAEPLLSGVYGGNAAELSARSVLPRFVDYETNYGSLIRGVRRVEARTTTHANSRPATSLFLSFRDGMSTLVKTLERSIADTTGTVFDRALEISRNESGWRIHFERDSLPASSVVLACPAYVSAQLLESVDAPLTEALQSIPYSSATLVTLLFDKLQVHHPLNGFGFLVPPPERRTIAAATWINTKFPSRVAAGKVAVRSFLVDPEASRTAGTSDEDLVQLVRSDLEAFMGIGACPQYTKVDRWPRSLPQYTVGHQLRVEKIRETLLKYPDLFVASNYLDGVGIPDCVRIAKSVALQIQK